MVIFRYSLIINLMLFIFTLLSCSKNDIKPQFKPKEAFNQAVKLIEDEKYEEARELLIEIKNRDTSKEYAPLAQLKIADSFAKEEEFELAVNEYRYFLSLYPDNRYAYYAQYQIANIHFNQIRSVDRGYRSAVEALREFKKLNDLFPRNPYKEIIPKRIMECRNILAGHEHYVGKFYFKKEAYNAALGRFNIIIETYNNFGKLPEVYYMTAMSYKRIGNEEKARDFFLKTVETSTKKKLTKKVEKELKKIGALPQSE